MKKPIIGITLDSENPGNYSKFPWYAIRHNYLHSIEAYGGVPFPLSHSEININKIFSDFLICSSNLSANLTFEY